MRPPQPFSPPTVGQVLTHLKRYPAREPSKLTAWMPIIAMATVIVLTMVIQSDWVLLLPWLTVGVVFVLLAMKMRNAQRLEQRITDAQELAMLRHWRQSLRLTWRLIPSLVTQPPLHGRAVALIAHCLDQLKAYDAAITAYNHLIDCVSAQDPVSIQIRIHRTIAQLANDQLIDADDDLRKLRTHTDVLAHPVIGAAYKLAQLVQQVRTNHWAEAVEDADQRIDHLRPLGVDAGYGYALTALSYYKLDNDDTAAPLANAGLWWSRATLLLPVGTLVDRFAELDQIAHALPAQSNTPPRLTTTQPQSP